MKSYCRHRVWNEEVQGRRISCSLAGYDAACAKAAEIDVRYRPKLNLELPYGQRWLASPTVERYRRKFAVFPRMR